MAENLSPLLADPKMNKSQLLQHILHFKDSVFAKPSTSVHIFLMLQGFVNTITTKRNRMDGLYECPCQIFLRFMLFETLKAYCIFRPGNLMKGDFSRTNGKDRSVMTRFLTWLQPFDVKFTKELLK